MLKRLFGRRAHLDAGAEQPADAARAALLHVIAERREDEPLLGARLAGREVLHRLMGALSDERGVHIESLVTALGALGGRACQAAALAGPGPERSGAFVTVQGANGDTYLFGDAINRPLVEADPSFWSLVAGMTQHLGAALPDLKELFAHNAAVLGTADYGRPRFAEGTAAGDVPINYAREMGPSFEPLLREFCSSPEHWPLAYGFALQELLQMAGDRFDLTALTRVAMDSAIAMAKLRPR